MERADGYPGLRKVYDLQFDTVELDPGLMYKAIKEKKVDVISGFSTDGRIKAYNLKVLDDDKNYFPPYYAAPFIRGETLRKYPELRTALEKIAGKINVLSLFSFCLFNLSGGRVPVHCLPASSFMRSSSLGF